MNDSIDGISTRAPGSFILRGSQAVLHRVTGISAFRSGQVIDGNAGTAPRRRTLPRMSAYRATFLLLVVIPTLTSWVYLAFLASNQYVAETRFAVRAAQMEALHVEKQKSATSSLASGSMVSLSGQDAYIGTPYIRSRSIIDDLLSKIDIRAIYTRPEGDFWARLKRNASAEDLLAYWNGMVSAYVDGPSGVVTVSVRSFRPDDSVALASAIITASESLVNDVSARARNDAVRRSETEVRAAEARVRLALADMQGYRDKEGYIDPTAAATATSQLLAQVTTQKIQLQNDLFVATRAVSADAPQLKSLQTRLVGLDQQIAQLKAELTGNSAERKTVAASLAEFEELELHRIFAEKLYSMTQDALERARVKAENQNIYISVFVPPSLPQDSKYPERLSLSIMIAVGLAILWSIGALTVAAIDDHRY